MKLLRYCAVGRERPAVQGASGVPLGRQRQRVR